MKQAIFFNPANDLHTPQNRVLAGGILFTFIVLICTGLLLWQELRRTEAQDRQRLELLASFMEAHAIQIFDTTAVAIENLAGNLATGSLSLSELEAQLQYRMEGLPFLRSIAIIDQQGLVAASTNYMDKGAQIDLEQLTLAPLTDERVVIGPWVRGRGLADNLSRSRSPVQLGFIPMLRAVPASTTPGFTIVAQINPDSIANFQQQIIEAGSEDTLVLLALDKGILLTEAGNSSIEVGINLASHPFYRESLSAHKGTYGPVQTFASRNIGAWHRSSSRPLVTFVEQPYANTIHHWLASLRGPLLLMTAAVILIAVMTYLSWRNAVVREIAQMERDSAQQRIMRSEQELSTILKSVQELIFRTDNEGKINFVNARWESITKQPIEKAKNTYLRQIVSSESKVSVDKLFSESPTHGVRMTQAQLNQHDDEEHVLDISVVPLQDSEGQFYGFVGSAVDVTPLLNAQRKLEEQLAFTAQVLESNPLPICITDADGRFLSVNQAWEEFMGLPRSKALGLSNSDLLPPQEATAYNAYNEQLLTEGGRVRYEERIHFSDGSFKDVQVTKVRLNANNKKPIGILAVKLDITQFLAARDIAEEASRFKSEFLANISHELRTPLQTILGFSELGITRSPLESKQSAMFSDIHSSGLRMLALVNDLLDIAKIDSTVGAFNFEFTDIRNLIKDVIAEFELQINRKNLNIKSQIYAIPLIAKVDPSRFSQVIRNVVANAIKFSPERGSISITAHHADDQSIKIQISDQGPGIPNSELETIFQAFVQSSLTRDGSGGTGLGLAICRKILNAHNGSIYAINVAEGGAMFDITLPAVSSFDAIS